MPARRDPVGLLRVLGSTPLLAGPSRHAVQHTADVIHDEELNQGYPTPLHPRRVVTAHNEVRDWIGRGLTYP